MGILKQPKLYPKKQNNNNKKKMWQDNTFRIPSVTRFSKGNVSVHISNLAEGYFPSNGRIMKRDEHLGEMNKCAVHLYYQRLIKLAFLADT